MANVKKVEIYSTPTCHYCGLAKEFLKKNNIPYSEYNVATDMEKRKEMVTISGQLGVPVIVIDGNITVGFEEAHLANELGIK